MDAVVGVFLIALGNGELGTGNEIVSGMGPNKNHKYLTIKTIKGLGHKMYNLVVSFLVTYLYTFLTPSKRCDSGLVGDAHRGTIMFAVTYTCLQNTSTF